MTAPRDARPVLLLDVMDTLVRDPVWDVPAFFGTTMEEVWRDKHPTSWVDFELGRIDSATFLRSFFADGRDYDRDAFAALFRDGYDFLPGVEELLADLLAAGVAMHALSNYPSWWRWIEERLELSRFLGWSFVSCRTGFRKPDPRAYLHAADTLGVAPAGCLFVDDRGKNCKAATEVGMPAIRFESAPALRAELAARGILRG